MIRKKKGFVLLPVVLATFIMGMLGIGLASMYSGTFSTMNAGKAASKAKDFATIEGNYVKLNGYDTASSMTHDWESLSDLVGPDATGWQSKVETSSTATSADGNQVKVMKVAVKKDSDIASRYTYEVPVVQGKDSYTKAEIDAMMSVVNGNFTKVNNRIDAMIEDTNNIKTQINNLYADMDSLNKNLDKLHTLVENYRTSLLNSINGVQGNLDAEIAARKAADASESSARQSADNALNKRCDNIDGKIKDLQGALSNTQERVKSLEGRVSSLEGRTKNLEDRASALESGLDAETKARIAADKSITDELHSVRDNLTEKYKALKTSVDDIGGKVKNMSKDVKANTDNIASINELLKNSFVFNGKHNTGISLAYDATQKKMRAYYNGQEVPLGSQGGSSPQDDVVFEESQPFVHVYLQNNCIKESSYTYLWASGNGLGVSEQSIPYFLYDIIEPPRYLIEVGYTNSFRLVLNRYDNKGNLYKFKLHDAVHTDVITETYSVTIPNVAGHQYYKVNGPDPWPSRPPEKYLVYENLVKTYISEQTGISAESIILQ